jgi:hypothetical protein
MTIRFLHDKPALLITDRKFGRILCIADVHLGIEHELYKNGVVIAPQAEKFYRELESLLRVTKATKLVILGDLKHKIPGISPREVRELPKLIEPISKKAETILVKGNHDTELEELAGEHIRIVGSEGFAIGPYGFFHGHAWPAKELLRCDYLFTAHIHPVVEFVDDFGFRLVEKVWAKGVLDEKVLRKKYSLGPQRMKKEKFAFGHMETIVFPSFNPIISGMPLNSKNRAEEGYLGPLMRSGALKPQKMDAYMLDGTHLGKITKKFL